MKELPSGENSLQKSGSNHVRVIDTPYFEENPEEHDTPHAYVYKYTGSTSSLIELAFGALIGSGIAILAFKNEIASIGYSILFFLVSGLVFGNFFCLWCLGFKLKKQLEFLKFKFSRRKNEATFRR